MSTNEAIIDIMNENAKLHAEVERLRTSGAMTDHTFTAAQTAVVPVAWRWKPRRSRNWIACDKLPEFTDDADVITEALYSGPVAHSSADNVGEK